jgi:hypothetical protein
MRMILMTDLKCILEATRITFAQHEIFSWTKHYKKIDGESDKIFPVFVNYEIVGSFISENKIKMIISLREFSFSEDIFKRVLRELEEDVTRIIAERIPETDGKIEIIFEFKQRMLQLPY